MRLTRDGTMPPIPTNDVVTTAADVLGPDGPPAGA